MRIDVEIKARQFSRALFDIAIDTGCAKEIYDQVVPLHHAFKQNNSIIEIFSNMNVNQTLVEQTFDALQLAPLLCHFLKLVVQNRQGGNLVYILDKFEQYYEKNMGKERILAKWASPTEEAFEMQYIEILSKLLQKDLILTSQHCPELLGGVRFESDEGVIDLSVNRSLKKLRENLLANEMLTRV